MSRLIDADALINELNNSHYPGAPYVDAGISIAIGKVCDAPTIETESLTDKEQRIFLAAMGREEKVCEEVDRNHVREPYEDSLMRVCKEIRRKVKVALWNHPTGGD